MDAVKYCEESRRMCDAYWSKCWGCPAGYGVDCKLDTKYTKVSVAEKVAIVEHWANEHPVKTRQSEFLKQWPNAKIGSEGTVAIDPCIFDTTVRNRRCIATSCTECRREFWMQEVE